MITQKYLFSGLPLSEMAPMYARPIGYSHAMKTVADCLRAAMSGGNPPDLGSSVHGLTNRLQGMVLHLLGRKHTPGRRHGVSTGERTLIALIAQYALSAHAQGPESYANIKIKLALKDSGSAEEIPLLHVWSELITAIAHPRHDASRPAASEATA